MANDAAQHATTLPLREPRFHQIAPASRGATTTLDLSVVVPCYDEEACLQELHRRVSAACRSVADSYELILVNDGSRDRTWEFICSLAGEDRHVVGVNLSRNYGHQLAVTAGLSFSRGNRVLVIDADMQDPPELVSKMLTKMDDERADVVYAVRARRLGEPWYRTFCMKLAYRLIRRLSEFEIPVDAGDFRLMSRRVVEALNGMPEQQRYIRGMCAWIGFKQVPLEYERPKRYAGKTHYPFRKLVALALHGITSFSILPLRIASQLGMMSMAVSGALDIYALASWLSGTGAPRGWTSLMAVVVFFGSIQLLMLGVLGEYVGRVMIETKRRPLFVVDQLVTCDSNRARTRETV